MISIRYSKDLKRYMLPVNNFIIDDLDIRFKFDTGADCSVVNVSSLFPSIDLAERAVLYVHELISKKTGIRGSFTSVSGGLTNGILCYIRKFKFNDESIPFDFYFYLITSTAYRKALIGVDFISCCDFSCEAGKDINITKFYTSRYRGALSFEEKAKAINVADILKAIQTPAIITRHKIVKNRYRTKTLAEFIEKVNQPGALDSLDFENSLDDVDLENLHNERNSADKANVNGDDSLSSMNLFDY